MAKIPFQLKPLLKISLVFSFAGFSFLLAPHVINVNVQVNANSPAIGNLFGFEVLDNGTFLTSIDPSTGVDTQIGQSIQSLTGGSQPGTPVIDPANHRIFYFVSTNNGNDEAIVAQDTQTGAILNQVTENNTELNGLVQNSGSIVYMPPPPPQLTSLAPAQVWMSHGTLDAGIKLDVQAQAFVNSSLVSSGEIDSVTVGSNVGPDGITQQTIPFNSFSPVNFPSGSTLSIKISARNACSGSGKNSGTANLWYNTNTNNSNFGTTIDNNPNIYYLLANSILGTLAGSGPLKLSSVPAGAKCSPFQSFGTWAITP